jgi:adenylylsulfate kinase-like enzyme
LAYCQNNKPDLYQKAVDGKIENMPGVDARFDIPAETRLTLKPGQVEKSTDEILNYLSRQKIFPLR